MNRLALLPILLFPALALANPGAPTGLLTNLLSHPESTVITDDHPRFSWIVSDPSRGATQSAYEITLAAAESDKPLWSSGKVTSPDSTSVPYAGRQLLADHTYSWTVRTWDAHDHPSPPSQPQSFNTGSFNSTRRPWPGDYNWTQFTSPDGAKHWTIENQYAPSYYPIPPTTVLAMSPSTSFITFPKDAFSTLRLTLTSPDDRTLTILLGEKKTPDNHVDPKPGGSIYHGSYPLQIQKGTHTYDLALPRHISKMPHSLVLPDHMPEVEPFRYAEITNLPGELKPDDLKQLALFYPFDDTASSFTSSDKDLNAVWDLCKYTMKATPFLGIYTDGVRERMPYEADAYIQTLGHFSVDREYAIARHSAEFLDYHATWPTEWILQSVLMAHADYMATADPASLQRNYDTLKAKLLLPLSREDGLISTRTGKQTPDLMKSIHYDGKALKDITDWPQPSETDGFVFADYNTVTNAFHYKALCDMADIAAAANHPEDAKDFRARAEQVKTAFNKAFLSPTTHIYTDGESQPHSSLHANAFPLAFGLVPQENIPAVVKFLQSRQMNCGPYGAQFLLEALYNAGAQEHALSLLTNHTDRGWLHMLDTGSTMTTESWDIKYKKNLTWNHAWGAAPANLIPRKLMGIEPLEPGFKRIRIRPQPSTLTEATVRTPTIRGPVTVSYHRTDQTFTLTVTIPANTTAEITIPTSDPTSVRADADLNRLHDTTYEIPAGTYHFTAAAPPTHKLTPTTSAPAAATPD